MAIAPAQSDRTRSLSPEVQMPTTGNLLPAASVATAGYFAVLCGLDGTRTLMAPLYGFELLRRSEPILAIARAIGLGPDGQIGLAASLGAFELAIMGVSVAYLIERLGTHAVTRTSHAALEAALILIAGAAATAAALAAIAGDLDAARLHGAHLALAGLAALLALAERRDAIAGERLAVRAIRWDDEADQGWFSA
jgi:hypothetical protein